MNLTNSNYIEEILNIIQTETNSKKLSENLSNYHDNDIANSLELLSQLERKKLYRSLGIEKTSEIFAYLEDATSYLEEIELEKAAKKWILMMQLIFLKILMKILVKKLLI